MNTRKKVDSKKSEAAYSCEYCSRSFVRETTLIKHICETKNRMMDIDRPASRIGFNMWNKFYTVAVRSSQKDRTKMDFVRSPYYASFMKFSNYCIDVGVFNIERYTDWLLKHQVPLHEWKSDTRYGNFLIGYLYAENPIDAISRSLETTISLATSENIRSCDYLRYGNANKICYNITTGKISPWMMYQSSSGKDFLSKLNETQTKIVMDYIDPPKWALKFNNDPDSVRQVKHLMDQAGY
jgi:hypothetical protein